jgi:hypothetical protein
MVSDFSYNVTVENNSNAHTNPPMDSFQVLSEPLFLTSEGVAVGVCVPIVTFPPFPTAAVVVVVAALTIRVLPFKCS